MEISIFKIAIGFVLALFLLAVANVLLVGTWMAVKIAWLWVKTKLNPAAVPR